MACCATPCFLGDEPRVAYQHMSRSSDHPNAEPSIFNSQANLIHNSSITENVYRADQANQASKFSVEL